MSNLYNLQKALFLVLSATLIFLSHFAEAQTKNQLIFDQSVDYINCRIAQLSLEEQDNGRAPHIAEFKSTFQCDKSLNNNELVKFLQTKNLGLNVKLNNSVNEFKNKFSPTLNKDQLVSLLEDDLLEVRLESFAANHVDSYNMLRKDLSKYIGNAFDDFDKKQIEKEIPEETAAPPQPTEKVEPDEPGPVITEPSDAEKNRGVGFLIWMIIGAFIGALLYNMFLRYFRKRPAISPGAHDLRAFRNKNNALKNELDNLRLQNSTLLNEITGLKKQLFALAEKLNPTTDLSKTGLEEEE